MTSHIFVAMGLWDDVVAANIRARDVQNAREVMLPQHHLADTMPPGCTTVS